MITKVFKYTSFEQALRHVLGNPDAKLIYSNMCSKTSTQLAKEFMLFAGLHKNLNFVCYHIVMSISCRNAGHVLGSCNEHLSDSQYGIMAQRYLEEMGLLGEKMHKSQYMVARHSARGRQDIHILVSRVRMNGTLVPEDWETKGRSLITLRRLKNEFSLDNIDEAA
jgi:hypothetical protein